MDSRLNKKLAEEIKKTFTNDEILRIFDLANRRLIDNGLEYYTKAESDIHEKIKVTFIEHGKGKYA